MDFKYIRDIYNVPAEIGRAVTVDGEPGVIAEDRGNYIGVNFDCDKPGVIKNCHPTWKVEYGGMKEVRELTEAQKRYQRYLDVGDCFEDFMHFCQWEDSQKEVCNV